MPLLLRIMHLNPLRDLEIERMFTALRSLLLQETMAGSGDGSVLPFSIALSLQCFTNEYVFSESDADRAAVEQLQEKVGVDLAKGEDVRACDVITLSAYRPLYGFSWAGELCERVWEDSIQEVIRRQVLEPREELSLRTQIPRLTTIQNMVSHSVREQYEENPYPRWIRAGLKETGKGIGAVLEGSPLRFDLGDYVSPERPDILVAGCGTGQHALLTAATFSNSRVLAIDLSLSSLSYAMRKTNALGVSGIEYAQADIMELGNLGRQFDLIESVGVLHHLDDPLAGWGILVDLLRPGGVMKIGLYSELACQHVVAGRSLIAEKGYTTSAEEIRRCRQDIIAMGEGGNGGMKKICDTFDFFNLSECRDLLFHVQEHRFTLPQIEESLEALQLGFLGFEMRNQVLKAFGKEYPGKHDPGSLSRWHKFELDNPDTFWGMYQFWCKKN